MSTTIHDGPPTQTGPRRRSWHFPSAFTVLFGVTVAVWLLAFVVPTGAYELDDSGAPIPGTYGGVDAGLSFGDRLMQLFLAPVNGLYGVEATDGGFIGPYETGELLAPSGSSCSSWPSACSSRCR